MKIFMVFTSFWLISSMAFSNGSLAPELPLISNAKLSAEYPVLKQLQDLTLDLQLLEIALKNRRDKDTEIKISEAMRSIEIEGTQLAARFKELRREQLHGIYAVLLAARRYGVLLGVGKTEWDELFEAMCSGQLTAGPVVVRTKKGTLGLLQLAPLYVGRQWIWSVGLPAADRNSYWVQARVAAKKARWTKTNTIHDEPLKRAANLINEPYAQHEQSLKLFFSKGYSKLYAAFDTHRYAVLQRAMLARRTLDELGKLNSAMGAPEEFATLYNQLLDNLFSYGIDFSLSGSERDFTFKGFLFAESPEQSQALLNRLKVRPNTSGTYNSPSS